jgi:hypothetical protein
MIKKSFVVKASMGTDLLHGLFSLRFVEPQNENLAPPGLETLKNEYITIRLSSLLTNFTPSKKEIEITL